MIRTQVYLTELEQKQLNLLAQQSGVPKSEMIREAIDAFLQSKLSLKQDRIAAIRAAAGMWADRDDMPDFTAIRKELDR